jgi:hypothetical protein
VQILSDQFGGAGAQRRLDSSADSRALMYRSRASISSVIC